MNNLRAAIETLFRRVSPDRALEVFFDVNCRNDFYKSAWNGRGENQQIFGKLGYYSHDEVDNVWNKVECDWAKDPDTGAVSVFGLLFQFCKKALVQSGNDLNVEFGELLRWRELSLTIGEDLLTTCFLAQRDRVSHHRRSFFGWSPILKTNNLRLKELLKKGTAENHFHLGGSAPHLNITWIALMNSIVDRKQQFKDFLKKGKLAPNSSYGERGAETELYILTIKACYIRAFLFRVLKEGDFFDEYSLFDYSMVKRVLKPRSNSKSSLELIAMLPDLQRELNSMRYLYGKVLDKEVRFGTPDYCIPKNIDVGNMNGNIMLCGERKFLYDAYQAFFNGDKDFKKYGDLFYTYLIIKSRFREEMIQVNDNVGFANFSNYQGRKGIFLDGENSLYRRAISNMAANASSKNQAICSLEARMKPKSTKQGNVELIKDLDGAIEASCFSDPDYSSVDRFLEKEQSTTKEGNHFYVTHFIKSKDKEKGGKGIKDAIFATKCRDAKTRDGVAAEAKALVQLRESLSDEAKRIRGIDAASSETDCRPEAFAQGYRYMKYHRLDGAFDDLRTQKDMPVIKATFHAGEDFYDLVDGMRAIDEAIKFLNLGQGDRIGHALALGVDPRTYYEGKQRCLMLPKQWHLDNIVWLMFRISRYKISELASFAQSLEWDFQRLFNQIYGKSINGENISPIIYERAWMLRGDDPYLYQTSDYKEAPHITFWDRCAKNETYPFPGYQRDNKIVNKLYYLYHFDPDVKRRGNKIQEFYVSNEYIKAVALIQKEFQKEIARKHLAIETNPSSNCLIGTFKRYDKHPLVNFYNLGLELDPQKVADCPQLFVSINTDDQGVFNTYLENEYALMALALEKMEDDSGQRIYKSAMIYDWLDRIRQMGLEMSFKGDQ